jgi:glycosyltransferase involved in cell wall biosynthesis
MLTASQCSSTVLCIGAGWFPKTPGGLDRYVYELTHHLAAAGHQVELCGIGLPETPLDSPVKLTNLAEPSQPFLHRCRSLRSNFLKHTCQPDAINLHFALYSFPLLHSLPEDVPITFTFHGPWSLESQWEGASSLNVFLKYWIEKHVYRRCDRFIVLSKAFGTILHHHYSVPWSKIYIIPGGVDTARFQITLSRQQARQQLGWERNRFILFTPRRLVQRMGLDVLFNALAGLKSRHSDIWLAVAGKGPQRNMLEQKVSELGLENYVKFLGYLPDEHLPIAYQAADLTVIPSQSLEGFGLVLLESLACGTPVLCTPVGGMPEILTSFSPDLITDTADAHAIEARLRSLLSGNLPLPSRDTCYEYASTSFNWSKISQQVQQVLLAPKAD